MGHSAPIPTKPSARQKEILDFVCSYQEQTGGLSPSIREIGAHVGLSSSSTVHSHIQSLRKKGHIQHDKSKQRNLVLTEPPVIVEPIVARILRSWLDWSCGIPGTLNIDQLVEATKDLLRVGRQ